jgi:hypothetical protein
VTHGHNIEVLQQNRDCLMYTYYADDCHLQEELTPLINDKPWLKLTRVYNSSADSQAENQLFCTKNLLVGDAHMYMSHAPDLDGMLDRFIDHILSYHGVNPHHQPSKHRILIFKKYGKRSINNSQAIANMIQYTFDVDVEIVEIYKYTLEEQIHIVSEATMIISPCGGISFAALFLPRNAIAIFTNYWEPAASNGDIFRPAASRSMEGFIYNKLTRFATMYYPTSKRDTIFIMPSISGGNYTQADYREYGNVHVNLRKLRDMLRSALHRVETAYNWKQSYRYDDGYHDFHPVKDSLIESEDDGPQLEFEADAVAAYEANKELLKNISVQG